MDVKLLHRQGASIRRIARTTGLSRQTVRRVVTETAPKTYGPRRPRPSILDPFVTSMEALIGARPFIRATVLYETNAREGYSGHYEGVKRWARQRRREESARRRACVRFETAPGIEGQFDWKGPTAGLLAFDPSLDVHFFRSLLAWSRTRWTLVVESLRLPAVRASVCWGFEEAGGVPSRLVFDNPKTAVLKPKPHLEFHPFFADFCRHYGREPDPAWPNHPERKGKAERSSRDLEDAGIFDRTYPSLAALQAAVTAVDEARMDRVYTTTGARPVDRLVREREALQALPAVAFDPRLPETRRVLSDCTVSFHGAFYSLPHIHVGSRLTVKADPLGDGIEIFAGAGLVAQHAAVKKGERHVVEEHVAALRRPRFERMRLRAPHARPAVLSSAVELVAWPRIPGDHRRIEKYVQAIGGAR